MPLMYIDSFHILYILKHLFSIISSNAEHDMHAAACRCFRQNASLSRSAEYKHSITGSVLCIRCLILAPCCPAVLNITARRNESATDHSRFRVSDKYRHKHISLHIAKLSKRHDINVFPFTPYIVNYPARRFSAPALHNYIARFFQMPAPFFRSRIVQSYNKITVSRPPQPFFYGIPRRKQVAQTHDCKII